MRDLNYQLKQMCKNNQDGSFATQSNRAWLLSLMANQLHDLGYRRMNADSLKPKHVLALVKKWKSQGISVGTQKNRLSALRWWAKKVRRHSVVAKDNSFYGIGSRRYVTNYSKSQDLDLDQLSKMNDPYIQLSLKLQSAFGLRREEAIKLQPRYAIKDDHIKLKSSWCKGGRARTVPIISEMQRELLAEVAAFAGCGALIPPQLNYVQQLHRYEGKIRRAGLSKLHGLRHGYAQRRFETLTGFRCPANGGPTSMELNLEQRALNEEARSMISAELGHSREAISAVYLGR
jgi:integrase